MLVLTLHFNFSWTHFKAVVLEVFLETLLYCTVHCTGPETTVLRESMCTIYMYGIVLYTFTYTVYSNSVRVLYFTVKLPATAPLYGNLYLLKLNTDY